METSIRGAIATGSLKEKENIFGKMVQYFMVSFAMD